jgi:hypothetical protein
MTNPTPPARARRSLVLAGLGAAIGLAIAGYGLFTSDGKKSELPPENLALVNNRAVLMSDFIAQTEAETGAAFRDTTPEQRRKVFDEMIAEELYVQRGLELDLAASDPDVRAALVAGVQQQIAADATAAMPDDAQLRDWLAKRPGDYASEGTMRLRDFVVAGGGEAPADRAAALVKALRGGASADDLIAKGDIAEPTPAPRRSFDFAVKARLGDALFAAADALDAGGVSEPMEAGGAVHVLAMAERQRSQPLPFEKAREKLAADYLADARAKLLNAELSYLKGKADILAASEFQR